MLIPLHMLKVAQACAVLLKTEPTRRMTRLRLLKLLYIADRQYLKEHGRPITGDDPVAMDNGPVLSATYDLIRGKGEGAADWQRYLPNVGRRDIELGEDPGVGKLSRFEIAKLQQVADDLAEQDDWAVADLTHQFAEWEKNRPPKGSSRPIPLDDVLGAVGLLDRKDDLMATKRAREIADSAFGP